MSFDDVHIMQFGFHSGLLLPKCLVSAQFLDEELSFVMLSLLMSFDLAETQQESKRHTET